MSDGDAAAAVGGDGCCGADAADDAAADGDASFASPYSRPAVPDSQSD